MATSEQAEKSIRALHNTELKGWKISVELAKSTHPKTIGGSTQESDVDASALVEEEGSATNTVQETKEEKSETDIPVEDGADGDAQAKEPSESVSDAANTTTGSKEDDKDSPPKVESKQAQPAPSGSTSGRRIIMVDKGDGKKELVRVGSAYGKGRQPLLRAPSKPLSPPLRITRGFGRPGRGLIMSRLSPPRNRGDARYDLMRGGMEHRSIHSRLGHYADPRADPRALEIQLHEERQRMLYQREMERQHLRRELEIEQHRKEQMFLRQMEEVRAREAQRRNIFEQKQREAVERERLFHQREQQIHEKERMLQEMERREKDRLEALEKQKEREYRERERRFREQLEKEMKEKEAKMLKERELREQQLRIQEQELRDKQNRLREEQERQAVLKEQERREQERQRRLQEEEIRKERERIREQERKEQQSKAAKRPFPGDHSDIPAKRQSFSPDTDSRALYAPFARGGQGGNARDNHQGSILGRFDSSELGAGRPVTSPYARNQSKPKEGMTGYPHATPMQDQSSAGAFGYGSRGPSSQFGSKLTSPGYDSPRDGAKGRSPYGSLTPELISAASRALGQVVTGGSLDRNKELGRGSMRGGHSRLPLLGQRSLGAGYLSDRSPSDMVSYPSVFSQSRAMSQPDLPSSGGFRATRASGYRDLPGDHWYDQGGYSSSRGGYSSARRGDYRRI